MNIIPPCPIPIFYWKEDIDSFLAAQGIKSFLEKNPAKPIALSKRDTLAELDGKYPIFVGVHFNELEAMPDISKSINCVIVSRYDQVDTIFDDFGKLPNRNHLPVKARQTLRNAALWKIVFNDYAALIRMGYEVMSNQKRANEVMPAFIKHIISLLEKKDLTDDEELLIKGVAKHDAILADDYPTFNNDIVKVFTDPNQRATVIQELVDLGRSKLEEQDKLVRMMIERSAMVAEFAGHRVKIAHLPSELADKAGWLLAKNMPFAVVFEDILKENKRIYHLYSLRGGLNVLEVGAPYGATGGSRYATFVAKIDFSNHKFI